MGSACESIVGDIERGYYICRMAGEFAVFHETERIELYYGVMFDCTIGRAEELLSRPYVYDFYMDMLGNMHVFVKKDRSYRAENELTKLQMRVLKGDGMAADEIYHSRKWMRGVEAFGVGKLRNGEEIVFQTDNKRIVKINDRKIRYAWTNYRGTITEDCSTVESIDGFKYSFSARFDGVKDRSRDYIIHGKIRPIVTRHSILAEDEDEYIGIRIWDEELQRESYYKIVEELQRESHYRVVEVEKYLRRKRKKNKGKTYKYIYDGREDVRMEGIAIYSAVTEIGI
jgi:hypothetical protein